MSYFDSTKKFFLKTFKIYATLGYINNVTINL